MKLRITTSWLPYLVIISSLPLSFPHQFHGGDHDNINNYNHFPSRRLNTPWQSPASRTSNPTPTWEDWSHDSGFHDNQPTHSTVQSTTYLPHSQIVNEKPSGDARGHFHSHQHRPQPAPNLQPFHSVSKTNTKQHGNQASNGGISALAMAPSIVQPQRSIPITISGEVTYFFAPGERALYKVIRIPLANSNHSHSHSHHHISNKLLFQLPDAQAVQIPPATTPTTTTTTVSPPKTTTTPSPPPPPLPPATYTPREKRKKYKLKFEFVLDDPDGDEQDAYAEEVAERTGSGGKETEIGTAAMQ